MDMKKAVADFIVYHEVKNTSLVTIQDYRRVLNWFADWLASAHDVHDTDDLQLVHLREWVNYLQKIVGKYGKPLKDTTVYQYGLDILVFGHWLENEAVIEKRITARFKLPKVEREFIPTFTPDDVEKMMDACESLGRYGASVRKAMTARNRAILSVLIDTGIRRSELIGLRLCDIDRDLRVLLIHRKGNKWQQVPISREGFKPLHEYLSKHRATLAALAGHMVAFKEDAVFLSEHGTPFTKSGLNDFFLRIKQITGIDDKVVSPHNCRRYMATSQLAMGRSPLDVQRQMGHTTLQMTNRYASLSIEQLQRSHEEYSPLRQRSQKDKGESKGSVYWDE